VTAVVASWLESGAVWLASTSSLLFGSVVGGAIALAVTWAAILG
jgi:hypothetical protein